MIDPLIRRLERRDVLSDEEKEVLRAAVASTRDAGPGEDLVREDSRPRESTLILEGFTGRYTILKDGKRHISALHVAGDFVDLHGFLLKTMDHGIVTLSPCRIACVPHDALGDITERYPHLTRLLWLSTLLDAAIYRTWLVCLGQKDALARMAHLICELALRLEVVGLAKRRRFRLPITQAEFGDALGMSTVHANRTVQELRARSLITWQDQQLTILDWDGLNRVAEFNATYLNLEREPR